MKLDVTDDGFLSLMSDDGSTKDDVKLPDGEVGDKINKLFSEDGKDTSESSPSCDSNVKLTCPRRHCPYCYGRRGLHRRQGGPQVLDSLRWIRRPSVGVAELDRAPVKSLADSILHLCMHYRTVAFPAHLHALHLR